MSTSGIYGYGDFTEIEPVVRWAAGTGWSTIRRWRGPRALVDERVQGGFFPLGYTLLEIENDKRMSTVSATYENVSSPNGENPTPQDPIQRNWVLTGNEMELPMSMHPKAKILKDRCPGWIGLIESRINKRRAEIESEENPDMYVISKGLEAPYVVRGATAAEQAIAKELTLLLWDRHDSFYQSTYVLRKTEVVLAASTIKISHTNVNRPHKYTTLVSVEPTLPAAVLLQMTGLQSLYWLKKTPSVEQTTSGRFLLTQEYWGGESWLKFTYGDAV